MRNSGNRVVWILLVLVFTFRQDITYAQATSQSELQRRAFVDIVNQHAITSGMIVSSKTLSDDCRIDLQPSFDGRTNAALARIFQEVLRSAVPSDIARFNRPRKPADTETFVVDPGDCALSQYVGTVSYFHPPSSQSNNAFTLRYGGANQATLPIATLIRPGERPIRILSGSAARSDIDLSNVGTSQKTLGTDLVMLWWGGDLVAEWYRKDWSVLKTARGSKNLILTLRGLQGTADVNKELASASTIAFTKGMVLSIQEKTKKNGVRQRATLSLEASASTRPLYEQTTRGKSIWSRSPTNFEAQIVRSLRAVGGAVRQSVSLTLDPQISSTLQGVTENAASALRAEVGENLRNRPIYASIAMIDGNTGSILGASGYPVAPNPQRFDSGDIEPFPVSEEFLKRRVIGSVAKVPIGFSVLASTPELQFLKRASYPGGPFETVLGKEIPPLHDHDSRSCVPRLISDVS